MADRRAGPRHRHQLARAVEGRQGEVDRALALGVELDEAREQSERRLGGRLGLKPGIHRVAARAQASARTQHAVDELAVEVAHLGAERALAEIEAVRVGRLEAGEVEDADIDEGDRDEGLAAASRSRDADRHGERRLRPRQRRGIERDVEHALGAVDAEPGEADGAARIAAGGHIQRPVQEGERIGARPPARRDREFDRAVAGRHVHRLRGQHAVADDQHRRRAGIAAGEVHLHGFCRRRIAPCRGRPPAGPAHRRWRRRPSPPRSARRWSACHR